MTNVTPIRPEGTARPPLSKLTEGEAAQLQHDSYLAQIRSQICSNCHCGERWIELYEVWVNPIVTARSKLAIRRPTTTIKQGFELQYFEMPQTEIPVCSECIPTFKVDEANAIPVASREQWALTLQRKHTPAPVAKQGRPETPLENL